MSQPRHVPDDLFPALAAGPSTSRAELDALESAEREVAVQWEGCRRAARLAEEAYRGRPTTPNLVRLLRALDEARPVWEALRKIRRAIRNHGHQAIPLAAAFERRKAANSAICRRNAEALEEAKKKENA